jgi:hypothetical protein
MQGDFNQEYIRAEKGAGQPLKDYSVSSKDREIKVYFRNIEKHLIKHIMEADVVVGCVAWLTNQKILEALNTRLGVALVINKKDKNKTYKDENLRKFHENLRKFYDELPRIRSDVFQTTTLMDCFQTEYIEPIRCVGVRSKSKGEIIPLMHNKFIVLCKVTREDMGYGGKRTVEYFLENGSWKSRVINYESSEDFYRYNFAYNSDLLMSIDYIKPYAVWTGSFNFTSNATKSFENVLYITEPSIVQAYFSEWGQLESLSESLDSESDSLSPEWELRNYGNLV